MIQEGAQEWAVHNFTSGCEVGDMLARGSASRPPSGRRWASRSSAGTATGYPNHASGEEIPLAMRVVHISHDMEAHGRLFSPAEALETARERSGRTYDPALADALRGPRRGAGSTRLARSSPGTPCSSWSPSPHRTLEGDELDDALRSSPTSST